MTLTERKITLTPSQIQKIHKSLKDPEQPLRLRLSYEALTSPDGVHKLYLGAQNTHKVEKKLSQQKGALILLTKEEREYNLKHGGFLGALLGNPIVSALAGPVLGAVASKAIDLFTGSKSAPAPAPETVTVAKPRPVRVQEDDEEPEEPPATLRRSKKGGILYAAGDEQGRGLKGPTKIPPPGKLLFTT